MNTQQISSQNLLQNLSQNPKQDPYQIIQANPKLRVSDGAITPIFDDGSDDCPTASRKLVLVLSQLGDFDSMEYIWWVQREIDRLNSENIAVRAIGIGDRRSGEYFCKFTGFNPHWLYVDAIADIHHQLNLYAGLTTQYPLLSPSQSAWVNLMLMCAGIKSAGTLKEVLRGYTGDRQAPQLIGDEETIKATPLPPLKGAFFQWAGGKGYQRPFELATLRLRNMAEVLSNWQAYVPDASYMTQRGGTFLFDAQNQLIYEHRDRGILGFAANPSYPLQFLDLHQSAKV